MNMEKYYRQLVGSKIIGFELLEEDGDKWPVFLVKNLKHVLLKVEVSRDPEGNGSGFLFISEDKGMSK